MRWFGGGGWVGMWQWVCGGLGVGMPWVGMWGVCGGLVVGRWRWVGEAVYECYLFKVLWLEFRLNLYSSERC